ncbi:MAG: inovirus Gp2 family protein [Moraxellaceae bacterium]|nr:MAG: inovirus Gp2 family protein [Moraxellaceae bacterium]
MNAKLKHKAIMEDISSENVINMINTDSQIHTDEQQNVVVYANPALEQICHVVLFMEMLYQQKTQVMPYKLVKITSAQRYQLANEYRGKIDFLKLLNPEVDSSRYDCAHYDHFMQLWRKMKITSALFQCQLTEELNINGKTIVVAEYINLLVSQLWEIVHSPAVKKVMDRRVQQSKHNYFSACKLVDALVEQYARLMVCRVDFALKPEYLEGQTVETMHAYLNQLLNNRRGNSLFEHMVGYIIKLEHGEKKGLHYHCLFLFDGSKVKADAIYAQKIGKYWKEKITRGKGMFYNCNFDKTKYRKLGIGMINHYEQDKIANLYLVIAYMTKASQFVMLKTPKNYRCFRRSEMPNSDYTPSVTRMGRPRRITATMNG